MADWYVSSVKYATLPIWQATHAYVIGDIIRPATAPAINAMYAFRCTTAGTSSGTEPTWSSASTNNATRTDGTTAIWTNVTSQSTYGWNAAAGSLATIGASRLAAGDRVFLSSDSTETISGAGTWSLGSVNNNGMIQIISVNRAGSVPPVAADIQNGAALANTTSGNLTLDPFFNLYWQGFTFSSAGSFILGSAGVKSQYFKDCAFVLNNATSTSRVSSTATPPRVTFDNTTLQFGHVSQTIGPASALVAMIEFNWINTPSPFVGATIPTTLFTGVNGAALLVTCRGVDLSAITGTLLGPGASIGTATNKALFDSCKIASSVTRFVAPGATEPAHHEVELVNCYDGTNFVSERHTAAGDVTTDVSTALVAGAEDDVGDYSHKMVSSSRSDSVLTLNGFWFDVENTLTGTAKTATVEIISSATLNNTDIKLMVEYMDTAGTPVADFVESLSSVLAAASALPSSSLTWNSPPSTPQKQKLQASFTPQVAGRIRGQVKLGKASATVWVNPQLVIT